ncbi:MAG: uncharacterized protein JWM09_268 [Francisellaceae bacterium]|nr:uncharacterized protein [Francisellaceae bacterium]
MNINNESEAIALSVSYLKQGKLVAFPTETVYGLGADANNEQAVKQVFEIKGRPLNHPLIVHIHSIDALGQWAIDIPPEAYKLAQHFWPGPLTLILKKHPKVLPIITGFQDTIAIRIPKHPRALELLKSFNGGLVGPSANRYGRISPTSSFAVQQELGSKLDYILEGGSCEIGIESTIVQIENNNINILRLGSISSADISAVLGKEVSVLKKSDITVPGDKLSHYAPLKPLFLIDYQKLLKTLDYLSQHSIKFGLLFYSKDLKNILPKTTQNIQSLDNPNIYARDLYHNLRTLDESEVKFILVESLPSQPEFAAIHDRLNRAAQKEDLEQFFIKNL